MASIIGVETLQHTNGTTAATIDSSGRITKPANPAFFANVSAEISSDGVLVFNTVRFNNGSHYSGTTGLFTAPVDGVYMFAMGTLLKTPNTTSYGRLRIRINGVTQSAYTVHSSYNSTRNYEPLSWSGCLELDANDTVGVYFDGANSAATYGGSGYTYFNGHLIG